ncbi:MAG: acetyltransferase [Phycisphaerales bacterium]|nr:acetyltransferase [Phycisphaerales bacterium]
MSASGEAVIYGAGGLGAVVHDILVQHGRWSVAAFLDSDPQRHGRTHDGLPIFGGMDAVPELLARGVRSAIVAIGSNAVRVSLAAELRALGMTLISAVHPLASVSPLAALGAHVIIGPRVTVCVHGRIGAHAILSAGAIVDHDGVIGEGAFLHPAVRLAGGVRVEPCATIGIGASVIPGRTIGTGATVQPGAVVIHDVPAWDVAEGVPAQSRPRAGGRFIAAPRTADNAACHAIDAACHANAAGRHADGFASACLRP